MSDSVGPFGGPGDGSRLLALATLVSAVAGLVAAVRGVQKRRVRRRRRRRIEERLKTHLPESEKPLDSEGKPDRLK